MSCGDVDEVWKFFCFRANNYRSSVLYEWFKHLDNSERVEVLVELRVLLGKLKTRRRENWVRPEFSPLTGKWRDLYEIRFKKNKKQYRFIGCFGIGKCEFVILVQGIKQKSDFYSRNCPNALERRKSLCQSEGRVVEFKFTGNLE